MNAAPPKALINQERRTKHEGRGTKHTAKPFTTHNMKIRSFEEIEGWQLGRELTKEVYAATNRGAFARDYGLRDQIQRASGSVMHNIAEGFDSGSDAEFVRFLGYSQRSCSEVQSQLYVAYDQGYVDRSQFDRCYEVAAHAKAKIGGFIRHLKRSS